MSKWIQKDLLEVVGMSTNVVDPGMKYAQKLLNIHTHQTPGSLTLRPGYGKKYAAPSDNTLEISDYLYFDTFFDRGLDENGKEITCEIVKGTVNALASGGTTIVPDTVKGLWFFCTPQIDGTSWAKGWDWINKTIITEITSVDTTYKNYLVMYGNADHGLADGDLVGWTIYNKTKREYAKIITGAIDGEGFGITHTLYNNSWEDEDVLIISKFWIDLEYQTELYNNLEKEEISIHKINNDLRIGFGGKANRPGLALGFRDTYFNLSLMDYTNLHSSIDSEAIEAFSHLRGLMIDTTFMRANGIYGIKLEERSDGDLAAGTYYFRLSATTDFYQEQLVYENSIVIPANKNINVIPYIRLGLENPRITKLTLYKSSDNLTFYKVKEYPVKTNDYKNVSWKIDEDGLYTLLDADLATAEEEQEIHPELHVDSSGDNAANPDHSTNSRSIGDWVKYFYTFITYDIPPTQTEYYLKVFSNGPINTDSGAMFPISQLKKNTKYNISLKLYQDIVAGDNLDYELFFCGDSLSKSNAKTTIISLTARNTIETFTDIEVEIGNLDEDPKYFVISKYGPKVFMFDSLSIKEKSVKVIDSSVTDGAEMLTAFGYTPDYNIVKGWDQALQLNGRIYYLNPYTSQRYENFILVSHIHSSGAYMWDIANFSNYRELTKVDTGKALGMAILPTTEIIIFKTISVEFLSDDGLTGILREPIRNIGCVSRNSIAVFSSFVIWAGMDDIYIYSSNGGIRGILEKSIRDLYLSYGHKEKIFGARDRFETYRLRLHDETSKLEYVFFKAPIESMNILDVIQEKKYLFAKIYNEDSEGRLNFINNGIIYQFSFAGGGGYGQSYGSKYGERL